MYEIESGKAHFEGLVRAFIDSELVQANVGTISAVGVLMEAENGILDFSFECGKFSEQPGEDNPAEMQFPLIMNFGLEALPMYDWAAVARKREAIVTSTGEIVDGEVRGSYEFARPIFDRVCAWLDECFKSDNGIRVRWLIVDEIGGGIFRCWTPGELDKSSAK